MLISALAPEIFILGMGCIILLGDVFTKNIRSNAYAFTLFALLGAGFITILTIPATSYTMFNNAFIIDRFACGLKLILYILLAAILLYSRLYMQARDFFKGEFFVLSLF